jgi:hypothetical protein
MSACAMIIRSQDNPRIILPDGLNGVSVRVQRIDTRLVFFVRGFSNIGRHILSNETIRNCLASVGAILMLRITQCGMIEHVQSDSFGVAENSTRGEILNSNDSIIAVFHPNVDRLERDVVHSIPFYGSYSAGSANNRAYKLAITPGLYIDNIRYNSANKIYQIIGGDKTNVCKFVSGLKQRFKEQGSNQPVAGTLKGVRVICKLESM